MKKRSLTLSLFLVLTMLTSTLYGFAFSSKAAKLKAPAKVTISCMISLLPYVSDLENNEFTKWMEAKSGVHLDMTIVPNDGYQDKLKVALASGNYPEIIMSGAASNNLDVISYGMSQKIYIPLNKLIDQYGTNIKKRWAEVPAVRKAVTAPDGNIYVLPSYEGNAGHPAISYKNWINVAWLKKLGLKMPTTTEEYKKVLMAFKNDDPNGNGKKDEVPMSGAINTWAAEPYIFLLNAFDYFDAGSLLKLKNNKFSFCADTAGFKTGLKYIHDLYANGLIDPAALTQDQAQLLQLGNSNPTVLGDFSAGHIAMGIDNTNMAISKQYDYLLPLKGSNGYQGIPDFATPAIQGGNFAITNKCKNPVAAIKMMDLLYDTATAITANFGPKGVAWTVADKGSKGVTGMPAKYKFINTNASNEPKNYYWAGCESFEFEKDLKEKIEFKGDILDPSNYEARLIKITNQYAKYKAKVDQIMPMWTDADTASKLTNDFTPINDYVKYSIVEFITGKLDVDKDWNTYINGLNKLGYKNYVAAYQKAYLSNRK